MERTIWKFKLLVEDKQFIDIPKYPKVLCIQVINNEPYLYAKVFPEETTVKMEVITVGAGYPAGHVGNMQYAGSYQLLSGSFVGHVFVDILKAR